MKLRAISLISAALLAGCASVATELPTISLPDLAAEKMTQEELALQEFDSQAKTLMRVAYPVFRDNAQLCPKVRPDIGIWTHKQGNYDKRMRIASARILGATDRKTIFQIAPDGPAAKAGLRIGDEILDAAGNALGPNDAKLADLLTIGKPVEITVRRHNTDITKTITAAEVCDYGLGLRPSAAINAYADGSGIMFTSGMMTFVENDNELALIVGHELAHNTMGHIRKILGNIILTGGATRYTRPFESEADYVGMYHLVRAGYSPDNVEAFWRRLAKVNPKSVNRPKTHPTFPDRYLRLAAAREEIKSKQAAGEALVPNFKKTSHAPAGDASFATP